MASKRYTFRVKNNSLYLVYATDQEVGWIFLKLEAGSTTLLGKVFTITEGAIIDDPEDGGEEAEFPIGIKEDGYFKINPNVLQTKYPVFLSEEIVSRLEPENFFVRQPYFGRKSGEGLGGGVSGERYIPLFPKLEEMFEHSLRIGGSLEDSIPFEAFQKAIGVFPDTEEVKRYMDARIAHILGEYVVPRRDYIAHRDNLIASRESRLEQNGSESIISEVAKPLQIEIFETAREQLEQMLTATSAYSEGDWQNRILDIILLLYPKYIHKEKNLKVKTDDSYGLLDIALFDAGGFIDVIEIKKPEVGGVGVLRKTQYRNNCVPSRELSGAIMQVEKYAFWLTRWGKEGETVLQRRYGRRLPTGLRVRIANPVGIIIFGRDDGFNDKERQDFEIIKRKYKHVVDILTYDDLLRRLKNILEALKVNQSI